MALIENVINKIFSEGYVKVEGGSLVFKGGIIDLTAINEVNGSGNTVAIAYASDMNGTGFTLVNNQSLDFMAFKAVPVGAESSLTASSFAGLWFNRKGTPGTSTGTPTNGTNGEPGGIRVDYSSVVTEEDPTTGKVRFNNTNLALATEMYISGSMVSGVDISGFYTNVSAGWYFMVKPNTNIYKPLFIFKALAVPSDNDTWLTFSIQCVSSSAEPFVNGDKLSVLFFGGGGGSGGAVTEASILAAGNFIRGLASGGYLSLIDNTNDPLEVTSPVYKLPAFTITGVTNVPAANTFDNGSVVRLHEDVLVGSGANKIGSFVQANAAANTWEPHGRQRLFRNVYGTMAAPTNALTASGKFTLGASGDPIVPAGLLGVGSTLILRFKYRKVGATQPTITMRLGTDLSVKENNSTVYNQVVSATVNTDIYTWVEVTFTSATTAMSTSRSLVGGGGTGSGFLDCTTLINIADDMKLTIEATGLTSDTVNLYWMCVNWE